MNMTQTKQKNLPRGIIALAVLGFLLIGGCVEKPAEKPAGLKDANEMPAAETTPQPASGKTEKMAKPAEPANRPPVLHPIGDKNASEESALVFTVNASDPDGDALAYSATNLPAGATFEPITRTFRWAPSQAKGVYRVTFEASDGGLRDEETVTITVGPPEVKTRRVENTAISGKFRENQAWGGEILITGDTHVDGDLTIMPGTLVRFVVGDDIGWGNEIQPDGYNDLDPTRLKSYEATHSDLAVNGKLVARGTPDKRIVFTSAAAKPGYADWVGIHIGGDGSAVEYSVVEWSRHGIGLGPGMPNTVVRSNVINHTLWGSVSSGHSSAQIRDNEIWGAGHEGIDVQGGSPVIENNKIYDAHTGIVVLGGSAAIRGNTMKNVGDGVHAAAGATPALENNLVELAPDGSVMKWSYGNFSYRMFGNPVVEG